MVKALRGQEAPPASPARNLARTLRQAAGFWTVFFLLVPAGLYALEELLGLAGFRFAAPTWRWAGAALFGIGGAFNLAAARDLAVTGEGTPLPLTCPRKLVVTGLYRYVRNPMAMAALAQGAGVGLFLGSPLVVLYPAAGAVVWHLFVRPWEERDLEERFGESYRSYRNEVRCWLPRRSYREGSQGAGEAASGHPT